MNRVQKDIELIIEEKALFEHLSDSTILINGATGLIGSMLMKTIYYADEKYGLGIKTVGQIRDDEKAKNVFGEIYDKVTLVRTPEGVYNYIIHTVSPTSSKFFIEHPVETIRSSVGSAMDILEKAKQCGSSLVYLSSMEQYGIPDKPGQRMTEDRIGVIDHHNIRSSYSESKRLCECLCVSYAAEYGVDVKIARLAQTFGAGVQLADNRMPMQFAKAVIEGRNIVLHTEGKSISNFVYLTDVITGILTILVKGRKGEAYNICNDRESRSVREIANLVADDIAGGRIGVQVEMKDHMGYAPDTAMYLDSGKLRKLGWNPHVDMKTAYERLIQYLQETVEK